MIKSSKFLIFVVFINLASGCFSDRKEVRYYSSPDYFSGIFLYDDSIQISSPYFYITQAMGGGEINLPCSLSIDHKVYDSYLELFPDSAIIHVNDTRFLTYHQEMYRSRWDSIVIRQHPISRPSESLALIHISNGGKVQVEGGWKKKNGDCSGPFQLGKEQPTDLQLRKELDYISPKTFPLIFSGDSDLRTYLSLKKCLDGNCQLYEGDQVAANYHALKQLLNAPSVFVQCRD